MEERDHSGDEDISDYPEGGYRDVRPIGGVGLSGYIKIDREAVRRTKEIVDAAMGMTPKKKAKKPAKK